MKKAIALCLLAALCVFNYIRHDTPDQDPYLITDYSRLHPVKVERVVEGREEEQLVRIVRDAADTGRKISIAGQRHSQGGHTYYKDGIVIDMTHYNKILSVDPQARRIRVQAGATWKDVQDAVNPYGLAVKTMQSQNIFTVGGSISINAHGRDVRNGSLIKSVESFRLLKADGRIIQASRTENADLFPLALGGFGLFGIILDVTLSLTEDEVYRETTEAVAVEEYSRYFASSVLGNPDVRMHIARISVAPDHFLDEMYAINYTVDRKAELNRYNKLAERESLVIPAKLLFNMNRSFDWGKNAFWEFQRTFFSLRQNKIVSRNNAMRSESEFMEYRSAAGYNDLLQEYFIPVDRFAGFVDSLKTVLRGSDLNLLNITVRYVNKDEEAVLSYARQNMFALVCLFHMPLSEREQQKAKRNIQAIIDQVLRHDGTYYLPYAPYPSVAQFRDSYPRYKQFWAQKREYDPNGLFMNYFYEFYEGE